MKYKRLTIEKITKDNVILHRNIYGDIVISQAVWDMFEKEHNQLCELEDKIERNELLSIEDIAKLWDKMWGAPCEYEICGENAIDVILENTGYNWCERNCGTVDSALCWEEYLKAKLKELQE